MKVSAASNFVAGNIKCYLSNWMKLTSDVSILETVTGYHIQFDSTPGQSKTPQISLSQNEEAVLAKEIEKFIQKGVINKVSHEKGEFISTVFTRPKKDGSHRMILNLKNLNTFVTYYHFKMESFQSAVQLMKKDCWMAVLDLKDAYYSVAIAKDHRKYLRFKFQGVLYEYTCLPNGLASAPRAFTKLMKPVYAHLRSLGHHLVGYIDDIILLAETPEQLGQAIM